MRSGIQSWKTASTGVDAECGATCAEVVSAVEGVASGVGRQQREATGAIG